jgi:hypothetical protein
MQNTAAATKSKDNRIENRRLRVGHTLKRHLLDAGAAARAAEGVGVATSACWSSSSSSAQQIEAPSGSKR